MTYGEAISDLAKVIEGTEQSAINQNAAVLETVADYLTTLATFVTNVNVTINTTVSEDHQDFGYNYPVLSRLLLM